MKHLQVMLSLIISLQLGLLLLLLLSGNERWHQLQVDVVQGDLAVLPLQVPQQQQHQAEEIHCKQECNLSLLPSMQNNQFWTYTPK